MTTGMRRPALAAGTWAVSDSRTRVTFAVRNLGLRTRGSVACRWGELDTDEAGTPCRLIAELDLNGLDTGIGRRDADLRAPRFLDIDRYPTMTWAADRFTRRDDGRWAADGVLRVRGTSVPLTVTGAPEVSADGQLRVRATATLDRASVGILAPRLLIGRLVEIDVDAWLSRRPPG